MNDINFPAGILQPPFYDFKIDPAVNFGGIGVVIGHEMTHGFDDQGSQFDPQGNVRMWWTADDRKKFDERTDCEVKEYDGFEVAPGQNLNGKLTLGENTADNGGLRIAYKALMDTLAEQNASVSEKDRRLHSGAAVLPRLRTGVVREPDGAVCEAAGEDRSALVRTSGVPTARCRTSMSSARPLAARLASR